MSKDRNIDSILEHLARREITPRQAIEGLVGLGFVRGDAGETVLFAVGGSDIIRTDDDGIERYHGSNKTVREVTREMNRRTTAKQRLAGDQLFSRAAR